MPTLGAALDFAKLEARNLRAHILGTPPAAPVTGQMYFDTGNNTLFWWDGSAWVSARGGASATPPATTTTLGTVQLAGDLTGTAASPQIAAGVITDAEVAAANKDGDPALPSMRTLTNSGSAVSNRRALADDTSLDLVLRPYGPVNLNAQKITALADPTAATDGANKQYVDNAIQGLDAKQSVYAASTANIAALSGTPSLDGRPLTVGDRVLVKDQTTPSQNGIYVVASGAWTRAPDMNAWVEVPNAYVWVEDGATQADTGWVVTTQGLGTIDASAILWVQFSGAGQVVAGAGLTKTGNTIDAIAGAGITVNADSIQVANNGITNAMLADGAVNLASADVTGVLPITQGGTNATTAAGARNNLQATGRYSVIGPPSAGATWDVDVSTLTSFAEQCTVQVMDVATKTVELADVSFPSSTVVRVAWGASVAIGAKRVTVVG